MSAEGVELPSGDSSGSETFARYRYQAKLTLLYWLGTLSDTNGLLAVYTEHVEDILLEYATSLVFMQIKTRAANAGVWTAEKMCSEGGGVDSLCRAYVVACDRNCTFELHLEGSVSSSRPTQAFVAGCSAAGATLRSKITGHLEKAAGSAVDTTDVEDFLSRARIVPNQPSQHDIDAKCVRMLARLAPNLLAGSLDDLYRRLLDIVETAQEARPAGLAPDADAIAFLEAELAALSPGTSAGVNPRRLTRDRLRSLIPGSASQGALLLLDRMVKGPRPVTALEEKLTSSGAGGAVILDARNLRAMADVRRMELLSGPSSSGEQLDDLCNRVLVHARGVALMFKASVEPAADIWAHLVTIVGLENLDQFGLFNRDRQSLVGLLCCLSDECRFPWSAA
jgi:hypothetical protein